MEQLPIKLRRKLFLCSASQWCEDASFYRDIDNVKALVSELLNAGIYKDEFLDITSPESISLDDIKEPLKRVLTYFKVDFQTKDEAMWVISAHMVQELVKNPQDIFKTIKLFLSDFVSAVLDNVCDLTDFYVLYYSIDDIDNLYATPENIKNFTNGQSYEDAIDGVRQEIVDAAQSWLKKYKDNFPQEFWMD